MSSFFDLNMLTSLNSTFDERQWVKQLCQTLDEEFDEVTDIPITIFGVPKAIVDTSPFSYVPQVVAIGPYHRFRSEVYDMERYKVAAAKRNQKELKSAKLHQVVDHLIELELRIQASYHRPLSLGPEALAWMMVVDACFLFEFFQVCGVKHNGKVLAKTPSRLAHLINLSENKNAHNVILRDIVMLENQIPLFVLRMLLEFQFSSLELADDVLINMLFGFCKEISSFEMGTGPQKVECAHLLDFLYHFIVPKVEVHPSEIIEINEDENEGDENMEKSNSFTKPGYLMQFILVVWQLVSNLNGRRLAWIKNTIKSIIFSKPLKLVTKLPWTLLTKIPIFRMVKDPLEKMFMNFMSKDKDENVGEGSGSNGNKPPLLDEITIPSVTELSKVGVQFVPINEGITSINFDEKTLTFYIPIVKLDVNSDVVLRNLVTYEVCTASGPLVFTRYTELMNGIIDTEEDAKLLCQRGIIINHLKSEKEVADLWNGMSRSIRLTKVPSLDKVIGDVNKFYNGRWKVKVGNFMKEYVFGSWRILTFFATIMLLLLMILQSFCQVYSCSRFFPIHALEPLNHHGS